MSVITVCGDACTTTSLALAATWPVDRRRVVVVEADPQGGALAAWLDLAVEPSLTSIVTAPGSDLDGWIRRASTGTEVITAPLRTREAERAVADARRSVLAELARRDDLVAVVDAGRPRGSSDPSGADVADVTVVVHRQRASTQQAEAVRVERLAESVERRCGAAGAVVLVVVGDHPFDPDAIARHVAASSPTVELAGIVPEDPLAAAVLAGRPGVSARRFVRLPLIRAARPIADGLRSLVPAALVEVAP